METSSDENRSPNSSYEQEGSSSEEDDLESGLATAVKGVPEKASEEYHYSTHKIGRNLMSKFSRASSSAHQMNSRVGCYHAFRYDGHRKIIGRRD
mmetsp:Transcript_50992/g.56947  ORF Transcript_50992/g.56947 Transcript_50992/m.56947 type:complete len:95 (+) Transcript_50992:338-622(+)